MSEGNLLILLSDLITTVGGKPAFPVESDKMISSVVIDSRTCRDGSLFIPLPGENTDGHKFIKDAVCAGASASLVSSAFVEENKDFTASLKNSAAIIVVDDPLKALQALGKCYLEGYPDLQRVGITGSSGKTTTKEILGAILSYAESTVMNKGNLNSEIGLPLSVLNVKPENKYAVFEMGMNHKGEIELLTDILQPDIGIVTNIGTAHIGLLGSQKAIAEEKKMIFSLFDGTQTAFLFEDDPWADFLAKDLKGECFLFGRNNTPGFEDVQDLGINGYLIQIDGHSVKFRLIGEYNLNNALCAVSTAVFLGIDFNTIRKGLESVTPLSGRSEIITGPVTVINDCYNANLDSVSKAVDFTDFLNWDGRKVYILGAMKELGRETEKYHSLLGEKLYQSNADAVFFFGDEIEESYRILYEQGFKGTMYHTTNYNDLKENVLNFICDGDLVLLKGSRSLSLERLLEPITRLSLKEELC